jgi:hypothetical protein
MPLWLLPLYLFAIWFVWIIACAAEKAVEDARRGVLEEQRGGVSILPGMPLFPLIFWGIALLGDLVVDSWGTWCIGLAHGLFLVLMLVSIARNWHRLRSLDEPANL